MVTLNLSVTSFLVPHIKVTHLLDYTHGLLALALDILYITTSSTSHTI